MTAYTAPLAHIRLADAGRVGRKAAVLGELAAAGFPVPPGFVVCADALRAALDQAGLGADATPAQVAAIDLPAPLLALAPGGPVAVRSSGTAEDTDDRSYAGQYESYLDVAPHAVPAAIRACWASAFTTRIKEYGDTEEAPGMAVLVQQMVRAETAGIAFSANPVTGDRGEVRIEAVRGLGDRLAHGTQTPEEWSVRGGSARRSGGPGEVLDAATAEQVADLAVRAAELFGAPQDIEWAADASGVRLLQSRPITALPEQPPEGFWLRGEYSLKPLSPMNIGTLLRAVNRGSPALFGYSLGERIEVRSIGGWSYVRFVGLTDPAAARTKLARIAGALRAGEPAATVTAWYDTHLPWLEARIQQTVELSELDDEALLAELTASWGFADEAQRLHFLLGGASSAEVGALGVFCADTLGWDVAKVLTLLTGLPGKTTEPSIALDELSDLVKAEDPRRDKAMRDYLDRYGRRCLAADIAEPTLAERQDELLRMATDHQPAPRTVAAARQEAVATARALLTDSARFDALLARAEAAYPLRDDSAFYAHVAWGLTRYAVLEIARRLVHSGLIGTGDDVFLLTLDEAVTALAEHIDSHALIDTRRAELAHAADHPGPLTIGTPPTRGPALAELITALPAADQTELATLTWVEAAYGIGAKRTSQSGNLLSGVAASPGRYTGPAKVIIEVADFAKLRPGDVLVCPETTPQWAVLFGSAGALVTDTGGLLSHPAIIAREYGVPAVVATGNATHLVRDGQLVTVDGSAGEVIIIGGVEKP